MFYGVAEKTKPNKHEHIHKTAFAVITLLFFNYVILRQITGLQQSFYKEQHVAIFLVGVANQTPVGIPASVDCYNSLFQGCCYNFYLLRPVI